MVRLHGMAGWPGSTLVAKANHFRLQQYMGQGQVQLKLKKKYNSPVITQTILGKLADFVDTCSSYSENKKRNTSQYQLMFSAKT